MYLLYNLILMAAALFLVPYYLLRGLRYGKSRRGIRERLGKFTSEQLERFRDRQIIWVHAVSVGETRAALPLLKGLRQAYPEHLIILSNITETGHAIAETISEVDLRLFFPFDFSWTVRRVLETVAPCLIIIVETEIWPNFTRQAARQGIPVLLVNGRISDRSYPRYRFFRWLLQPVLDGFAAFCMQSQVDAERIVQLGAPTSKVENSGNLKFDHELRDLDDEQIAQLKKQYRLPDRVAVLTAGSTHAGEEALLIEVYQRLMDLGQEIILVLIPRHPERAKEVAALLKEKNVHYQRRSRLNEKSPFLKKGQVLLVDTLGEVVNLYATSDVIFVGGSLVPIGGHNPLEASILGKPVMFGPHVNNFREMTGKLARTGAGIAVKDGEDLFQRSRILLDDPVRRRAMGQAGRTLIVENAGATRRTLERVDRCLGR